MRRRYIQIDGELVEVESDYTVSRNANHFIVGDRHYDGLRAPDAAHTDISTRAKHRDYMRRNSLTTIDDFQGEWKKAAEKRAEYYRGVDRERKEQVEKAWDKRR